ncbi:MAG: DUF3465 domain-containing protein [Oligoflexia bacterium]|nr:DUF3465 domain-containing protein [Oligoflexia bacterium]
MILTNILLGIFITTTALAQDHVPPCMITGMAAPVDNHQVLVWKTTTQNQFKARAHIEGVVTRLFPRRTNHDRFEIQLDSGQNDTIEVIFNSGFGPLPRMRPGMVVEACGDYITSYAKSGGYDASPSGALIHWVHENSRGGGHEDGFLVIDGKLYGYSKPVDAGSAREDDGGREYRRDDRDQSHRRGRGQGRGRGPNRRPDERASQGHR